MNEQPKDPLRFLTLTAWTVMFLVSMLTDALLHEFGSGIPAWLIWAKSGLLATLAVTAILYKPLRLLRNFALIMLVILFSQELVAYVTRLPFWQKNFSGTFPPEMMGIQLGRLMVSFLVICALLILGYRRQDFFLVRGQIDAPVQPVRWLGITKPELWTSFGVKFAFFISLGTLIFLLLAGQPAPKTLLGVLPMLPAVLLFAAMNAFNEEMSYRASLLSVLLPAIGSKQSLWLTAVLFGTGHYFGVPYGVVGVILATFLGWMMGKAMLETRGFFGAWFIHFLQDILIFSFLAIGSITPGG